MKRLYNIFLVAAVASLAAAACSKSGDADIDDPTKISFASAAFESALIEAGVDTNDDGAINEAEAAAVLSLDLSGMSAITSLAELSYFVSLVSLDCSGTGITELDVTSNTALESLNCGSTNIGSGTKTRAEGDELDLSKNAALKALDISNTKITKLDVSGNAALTSLNAAGCASLTELKFNPETLDASSIVIDDASVLVEASPGGDDDTTGGGDSGDTGGDTGGGDSGDTGGGDGGEEEEEDDDKSNITEDFVDNGGFEDISN